MSSSTISFTEQSADNRQSDKTDLWVCIARCGATMLDFVIYHSWFDLIFTIFNLSLLYFLISLSVLSKQTKTQNYIHTSMLFVSYFTTLRDLYLFPKIKKSVLFGRQQIHQVISYRKLRSSTMSLSEQ